MVRQAELHAHTCEVCGDFDCEQPRCPHGTIVTHLGHTEIERRQHRKRKEAP